MLSKIKYLKAIFTLKESAKDSPNFFNLLGKEEGIRELVDTFYSIMEKDSKALECKNTHPMDENGKILEAAKTRLYYFIVGFSGGPALFIEKVGPPKMRLRHAHIMIGEKERSQWIYCMNKALKKKKLKRKYHTLILNSFKAISYRVKNSV